MAIPLASASGSPRKPLIAEGAFWAVLFVVVSLLALLLTPLTVYRATAVHRDAILDRLAPMANELDEIPGALWEHAVAVRRALEAPPGTATDEVEASWRRVSAHMDSVSALAVGAGGPVVLELGHFREEVGTWRRFMTDVLERRPDGAGLDPEVEETREIYAGVLATKQDLDRAIRDQTAVHRAAIVGLRAQQAALSVVLAILALVSALFVAGFGWRLRVLRDRAERSAVELRARVEGEERARREVEATVRSRDDILAVVSHDLRNPLNAVAGAADLLLEETLPEAGRRRQLWVIRRQARQMDRLIQDLLDAARAESGRLSLRVEPVDVRRLLEEVAQAHQSAAVECGVGLRVEGPDHGESVPCDEARVHQVFSNLLGNALRYSPPGAEVTIRARRIGDVVTFSVADRGPGIPSDEMAKVFERYWQSPSRPGGAAGLGLATARAIVEAHGGRMTLESVEGEGTTVRFTLPADEVPEGVAGPVAG